jgi:RNA polymerase sigma-70 factor, ECF subfamily
MLMAASSRDPGDLRNPAAKGRVRVVAPSPAAARDGACRQHVDQLIRRHGDYLRTLARKLCRSQLDPDDLIQDSLEKALRTPMPAGANERAWLTRVTYNLFIDQVRRRRARREDLNAEPDAISTAEVPGWWEHLTADDVRAKLAALPESQRTTFALFAFGGKSYDAIAAELGIAKATVGTRISRARQALRWLFAEEAGEACAR